MYIFILYTLRYFWVMKKVRVNITLDQNIHEKALFFSKKEGKSLSENIELLLKDYSEEHLNLRVHEPEVLFNEKSPYQVSLLNTALKLDLEGQQQLLQFAEFMLTKYKKKCHQSAYGMMKGQIFMSDDFDEPLEMFKEYMP